MNFDSVDNKLVTEADEYIRTHRLLELFEVYIHLLLFIMGFSHCNRIQTT